MHVWLSVCHAGLLGGPGARGTWPTAVPAEAEAVRKRAEDQP